MGTQVAVGLADVKVTRNPDEILVAYSLGSCVGLTLWDPMAKVAGMAHVVLPSSGGPTLLAKVGDFGGQGSAGATTSGTFGPSAKPLTSAMPGTPGIPGASATPGKYADTAVPYLVSRMKELGCSIERLRAHLAGGAHVLFGLKWPGGDIGAANVKAVQDRLGRLGIPVVKADVGDNYGRTMRVYASTGRVTVSSVGSGERDI